MALFHPAGSPWLPPKGDIAWYVSIIERGYDFPVWTSSGGLEESNLAFFPLTPWLAEPLVWLGMPANWAMVAVSTVASAAAAWALYRIGELLHGPRVGFFLAVAWGCVLPTSIALSLPLSEPVFTALAAWALLLLRRELVEAGVVISLAGLSRPTALVLLLPLLWAAVCEIRRRERVWQAVASVAIAPIGFVAFVAFVGVRMGSPAGYLRVQQSFGSRIDFGASWIRDLWRHASTGPDSVRAWVTIGTVLGIGVLLAFFLAARPPAVLVLFTLGSLVLIVIQADHLMAVQRFVIPLFPLLIPLARGLARLWWPVATTILVAMTVLTAWYGADLLYVARTHIV